ncbi:MAG: ABC transporter ATP-binding protein [Woeseiaceae bacterium]
MPTLKLEHFQAQSLKPFSLEVKSEIICISGASGSGKSILLRSIADLLEHQGDVFLDNDKCSDTDPVQWRKWLGFLAAESAWWMDGVGEHFDNQGNEFITALNLPKECLTWDIARCSTGEKQRLAIARLLEKKPKALLLDEPTASLDATNIHVVEELIKNYVEVNDAPVLWVSHDQQQIQRLSARELKIENNKCVEHAL